MRKLNTLAVTVLLLLSICATAQDEKKGPKLGSKAEPAAMGSDYQPLYWRGDDARFALDTWKTGKCRIDAGQLAASQSRDSGVQELAERSVVLQLRINKQLHSMAKVINFKLDPQKSKHPESCHEAADLQERSGAEFDRAYLAFLSKSAQDNESRFSAESEAAPNSANYYLRRLAAQTLSDVSEEAKAAAALAARLEPPKK